MAEHIQLDLPLELQQNIEAVTDLHPGNLDREQIDMICRKDSALDLVLIENASIILSNSQILAETNITKILNLIRSETCRNKCSTFDYILFPEKASDKTYKVQVEKFKSLISSAKTSLIFTIIGLDLKIYGGHFAAVIMDKKINRAELFDSMQWSSKTDMPARSYYTEAFTAILTAVGFNTVIPDCISEELAFQYTGGVQENLPLWYNRYFEKRMTLVSTMRSHRVPKELENIKEMEKILIPFTKESTESQNHFCYMWAVFYIHSRLLKGSLAPILQNIPSNLDPLIIIKRYIWYTLQYTGLIQQVPIKQFFKKHFPCFWKISFNPSNRMPASREGVFNINFKYQKPKSMEDCFNWSIEPDVSSKEPMTNPEKARSLVCSI